MSIDRSPLSITSSFNAVKSFFNSQENNSKWKDLNSGAEGNFLMRMLSNVLSVISTRVVTGRREQFHDTANFMSSNIGLAVTNGYSVYRGRNQRRIIRMKPNKYIVYPKMSKIGTYGDDLYIYNTEEVTFDPAAEYVEFEVIIGSMQEITWNAGTNKLRKFVRFEQGISEDYALYMVFGNEEKLLPTSNVKKDMIYDNYYIYTNPWKSVSIEYLNTQADAKYKYDTDTVFKLKYIELKDFESKDFTDTMFPDGTVINTLVVEDYIPFEEIEDIKINSPMYRELQNLVRSKADTADVIKSSLPTIKESAYRPITPSYVAITYMKDDFSLIEPHEVDILKEKMSPMLYFGRPFPDIVNPQREVLTLDILLGLTDKYIEESIIEADLKSLIDKYSDKLKQTFDIYSLEKDLNSLAYITHARVNFHFAERKPYESHRMGDMIVQLNPRMEGVEDKAVYYKCTAILGMSSQSEPVWNIPAERALDVDINTGYETIDRELVWVAYKTLNNAEGVQEWKPNHLYTVGDTIFSPSVGKYMFRCVDIISYSAPTAPDVTFTEVGDYVEDGSLLLLCVTHNSALPLRKSNEQYRLGTKFNLDNKTFQYIGHLGNTSASTTLTFTDSEYNLYTIPRFDYDHIAPGNLFIDEKLDDVLHEGETLKVSLKEDKEIDYYEYPAEKMDMNSVLNVKVKEYDDKKPDDPSKPDTPEPQPIPPEEVQDIYINMDYADPDVMEAIGKKADTEVVNQQLALKADKAEVDKALELKANKTDVDEALKLKADKTELNEAVQHLESELDKKEDKPVPAAATLRMAAPMTMRAMGAPRVKGEPGVDPEPPVDPNANWKELEAQLALQKYVHDWIISEGSDRLRVPMDVLNLLRDLGKISRDDYALAVSYYDEYSPEDEKQIYLYMDKYGVTRMQAINDLGGLTNPAINILGPVISDAFSLKYYDKVTKDLVYVDRYDYNDRGDELSTIYTVTTYDADNKKRIVRQYYKEDNTMVENSEIIYKDTAEQTRIFLATIDSVAYKPFTIGGVIKYLTCITPTVKLNQHYKAGSKINVSFTVTDDGRVRWEEMDDLEVNRANWNVYNNFDYNLRLKK